MDKGTATRKALAAGMKRSGKCNCAEAVLCAYADRTGIDSRTAANITYAFAAGMGNTAGTCGALVGAGIALGLIRQERAAVLKDMKTIITRFRIRNGATICGELKGIKTGCPLRSCPDCVADAVEFLDEVL